MKLNNTQLIKKRRLILFCSSFHIIAIICLFCTIPHKLKANDSVYIKQYDCMVRFNSDSLFTNYAHFGYKSVIDNLYYYYDEIAAHMTTEKLATENAKMAAIARKYNSQNLKLEAMLMNSIFMPTNTDLELEKKIKSLQETRKAAISLGNKVIEIRSLEAMLISYWKAAQYAKVFSLIYTLDEKLQAVTQEEYPRKLYDYYHIGKAYYFFQDYDKAIPYLRKALAPAKYYFDVSNIEARNILGEYYVIKNKLDSAEYYYRSALYSKDWVKNRSLHDAISLSNIGYALLTKGEYDKAISYLEPGLQRMIKGKNYEPASYVAIDLGNCYLTKGDLKKVKTMIDSATHFIQQSNNRDAYRSLYPLNAKYYAKVGNSILAQKYIDSTILTNKLYVEKYNGTFLLRAEQELFESRSQAKDQVIKQKEETYRTNIIYSISTIMIIFGGLIIVMYQYRKKKRAYQILVQKNKDWAEANTTFEPTETRIKEVQAPNEDDHLLSERVHEFLMANKTFKNLDITLDSLAKDLNVNRAYLSKAINKTSGKNFNTYLNEYKVKEAIKIMSNEKMNALSIDAIALEVGFGNRISFYQAFKKITGLSPSDFRNSK